METGTAIDRRYVLQGQIGRGGVSVVYQALDTATNQPLAVKLLAPALARDVRARHKVHHEAWITDRLRHPSVPRVYDYGDTPLPDGSVVPYVAMELLTGVELAGRLAAGPLPWREAVSVGATVGDVLAVAHRRGIVHRDLTPANIMLTREGTKIIDFGAAVVIDRAGTGVDPADDVYALGVLLYEMLTGRSPYPTADPTLRLDAARFPYVAPTPVLVVPGMPRRVADICRGCMAKRTTERPDSSTAALALWSVLLS
jgi:serine/threonine-protein kinase